MKTKYFSLFLVTALSITLLSCTKSKNTAGNGSNNNPNEISIAGMSFPATSTVKVGSTVTWTNNDAMAHTVTSDDGTSFSSGTIGLGKSFSYTAKSTGSFAYHCNFHSNMKGTLVVIQ